MSYYDRQIEKAIKKAAVIDGSAYPGIAFFSDCHRGSGTWNDSFLYNKILYQAALDYYWQIGFAYVEVGDGDELWENRCFGQIYEIHKDVFETLSRFQAADRLFMILGNHDKAKEKKTFCTSDRRFAPSYYQSLIIKLPKEARDLCLIHGHQADILNDRLWPLARWMVRYLWKPLELAGFKDPTSAARNYKKGTTVENRLIEWAKENDKNVMMGHTHRPAMAEIGDIKYLNTGSCIHPNGVTCIELADERLRLIRWTQCVDERRHIYVCRQVLKEMNL